MEILTEYGIEIFFGLLSAGLLAWCKSLFAQKRKLEEKEKEDMNRLHRQMILDEIEPIVIEIKKLKEKVEKGFHDIQHTADCTHEKMYKDLNAVVHKTNENFELIIESYKYRLIQLCKTHIRDGFISQEDFEQVVELYKIYTGLGGNGQAQDYYEKVKELEILKDK